jgi:hypothetical protein
MPKLRDWSVAFVEPGYDKQARLVHARDAREAAERFVDAYESNMVSFAVAAGGESLRVEVFSVEDRGATTELFTVYGETVRAYRAVKEE